VNIQELIAEVLEQLRGSWRFRWWAVGLAWVISVAGWLYVYSIPDAFLASARVYVDTNSLLKPLMQGLTAQNNTMSEVQLVSTVVLTRPNLEAVARQTDLALRANSPGEFEALITNLQSRIRVVGGRDNVFNIQYEDVSREKARDVVAAILDTFVEGAIGAQGDDAQITERALQGEINEHEQRLRAAEAALAEFQRANIGFMPGESGDYAGRLQTALAAVAGAEEKIRQLIERRDELSRQLEGEEPVFGIMPEGGTAGGCSQAGHLVELRTELAALLLNFTEKHPRVVALQETIRSVEGRCAAETPVSVSRFGSSNSLELNPVYQNLRIQLTNAEVDLAETRSQLRSQQNIVTGLQRDVDRISEVETQLKQLNRDYAVVQGRHQELIKRWEDLQAKKRLDPVTDNVQFRRIEPPFALADPVGPNRPILLALVLAVSLGSGGGLAFGLNYIRPVYFSRLKLQRLAGLPVLGSISLLLTPRIIARRRLEGFAWAATAFALLAFTGLVLVFARPVGELVRGLAGGVAA
jgi:polysaccharide chain length determinant protein (PEP-CTERM system associated)